MSRTYKATGINLKSMALGEADRLLTILTREFGLIRAVAPGSRKPNSSLSGRSGVFVVNELLIAKGRSLDKITQAETQQSYPGLSQDLSKLAASQYLAEMVLYQALSEQPQEELFCLFNEQLNCLEMLPKQPHLVLAQLCYAIFHLLVLAGITPQVEVCCLSGDRLEPDLSNPQWQAGFSAAAGGTVSLAAIERLQAKRTLRSHAKHPVGAPVVAAQTGTSYQTIEHRQEIPPLISRINATELATLQQLSQPNLNLPAAFLLDNCNATDWVVIEQILRQYAQYHFGRPIRSAALIDSYFASLPTSCVNDDATV